MTDGIQYNPKEEIHGIGNKNNSELSVSQ